ncbi:MAG: hypothetical protein H6621_00725 [Halobacteriovoraceae bacterium]|nr:hypothetical protein [Halobacteriovoraceae bacterium]MCB9093564.1 hypothetical protein [Halobacteriovoraceae bacterium]
MTITIAYTHTIKDDLELFKQGQYKQIIQDLEKLDPKHKNIADHLSLLAKSYFKVEDYKHAQKYYELLMKKAPKDIPLEAHYEYGQVLYTLDYPEKAIDAFKTSYKKKYNEILSIYYIGVILHAQGNNQEALKKYNAIINREFKEDSDNEIKQAALAQKAEIILTILVKELGGKDYKLEFDDDGEIKDYYFVEEQKEKIRKNVIGTLESAIEVRPQGEIVPAIQAKIQEISTKYDLNSDRMINGRTISQNRWTTRFNAIIGYDSNVVTVSDEAPTQPEEKSSETSQLQFLLRRKFIYDGRYFINPEIKMELDHYFNRDSGDIYQNDQYTITPAIRMTREHSMKGKPASFIFDIDYAQVERDRNQEEEYIFYSRSYSLALGERLQLFDIGESTFKIKNKITESYDPGIDSKTMTLQYSQFFNRQSGDRIIFVSNFNFTNNQSDDLDTNSYSFILNYIMLSNSKWATFYTLGASVTLTDTLEQKDTRGIEKLYQPNISATKIFGKNIKLTGKYSYSKNDSKDNENYSYNRHQLTLDFGITF